MIQIELLEDFQALRGGGPVIEREWFPGATMEDFLPPAENWEAFLGWRNDQAVPEALWRMTLLEDGDRIAWGRVPGYFPGVEAAAAGAFYAGGPGVGASVAAGGGGAAAGGGFLAFLGSALLSSVIGGVISIALGYLIQALAGPKKPSRFRREDEGPSYGWDGIQNTAGPGRPVPRIYGGPVRVGGHWIQSYQRQVSGEDVADGTTTLFSLLALGLGPLHSISGVEINGQPIERFTGIDTFTRRGTFDQGPVPGFYETITQIIHAKEVTQAGGALVFETSREVDGFEVMFRFATLFKIPKDTLATRAVDVTFRVTYQAIGGSESGALRKTVSAATRSELKATLAVRDLRLAKYRITVERETVDDVDRPKGGLTYSTASEVYAISEIEHQKRAHPGLALLGLHQIPTSQLSGSAPELVTALVEGLEEVRIYSDATTYTTGYSSSPAWCAAAYLTDKEGGLGDFYTYDDIDIPSFLALAAYCDEMVSDGRGGLEKRATCAVVLDSVEPSDEIIDWFVDGCDASIRYIGGKWVALIDRAETPIWSAGEGNIFPGTFALDPTPPQKIANRVVLTYRDEAKGYQRSTYAEELPGLAPTEQRITATRDLRSVTRRSQAARVARRLLAHNKYSREACSFEAGLSAVRIFPGVVFNSSMPCMGLGVASGRILAVDPSGTELRIDEQVTLEAGATYEVIVHLAATDESVTKRVVNPAGVAQVLRVADEAWGGQVKAGDVYLLGRVGEAAAQWRAANVTVRLDEQGQFRRLIEAVRYDPTAYLDDLKLPPVALPSSLPDPRAFAPDPEGLVLTERLEAAPDGTLFHSVHVDFVAPIAATLDRFQVWIREDGTSAWLLRGETSVPHFEVEGRFEIGDVLEVSVVSVTKAGVRKDPGSSSARASVSIGGQIIQPPTLAGLVADIVDGTLIAQVEGLTQAQLGTGGGYVWRLGTSWEVSRLLERTTAPRLERTSYPRGDFVLLVKAVNGYGNESPQAASVAVVLRGQVEENIILEDNQHLGWPGIKTGFSVEAGTGKLIFDEPERTFLPSLPPPQVTPGPRWYAGGIAPAVKRIVISASYETAPITVSGGDLVTARPDVFLEWEAISIGLGAFQDATFPFSDARARVPFSGSEPDKIKVWVEVATSSTDASGFGAWRELQDRAELAMKLIRFRARVEVYSDAYAVKLTTMKISIDLPDKEVSGQHQALSATSQSVSFTSFGVAAGYFVHVKRLLLTVIGGAAGDTPRVTAQSSSGFTYELRNAAGSLTTGTIHFSARGY